MPQLDNPPPYITEEARALLAVVNHVERGRRANDAVTARLTELHDRVDRLTAAEVVVDRGTAIAEDQALAELQDLRDRSEAAARAEFTTGPGSPDPLDGALWSDQPVPVLSPIRAGRYYRRPVTHGPGVAVGWQLVRPALTRVVGPGEYIYALKAAS